MDINTGLGSAFDFAKGLLDRIWPKQATEQEKADAIAKLAPLIQERDNTVVQAKRDIMVAELNQEDKYTKRARPTVVYMGLLFIGLVHVIFPFVIKIVTIFTIGHITPDQLAQLKDLMNMQLPTAFWGTWGSVVSVWSIGRSFEKNGIANKAISMITGTKQNG